MTEQIQDNGRFPLACRAFDEPAAARPDSLWRARRAFTLVELLVVIAIIALLVSILLPALGRARQQAKFVQCQSNMRQINQAVLMYVIENDGYFPTPVTGKYFLGAQDIGISWPMWVYSGDDEGSWPPASLFPAEDWPLARYIKPDNDARRCPDDYDAESGEPYWDALTTSYAFNITYKNFLWGERITKCRQSALTVTIYEPALAAIVDPSVWNDSTFWWHPKGHLRHALNLAFVDGHVAFTPIQQGQYQNEDYRLQP